MVGIKKWLKQIYDFCCPGKISRLCPPSFGQSDDDFQLTYSLSANMNHNDSNVTEFEC